METRQPDQPRPPLWRRLLWPIAQLGSAFKLTGTHLLHHVIGASLIAARNGGRRGCEGRSRQGGVCGSWIEEGQARGHGLISDWRMITDST